jgi:hypothetical protein
VSLENSNLGFNPIVYSILKNVGVKTDGSVVTTSIVIRDKATLTILWERIITTNSASPENYTIPHYDLDNLTWDKLYKLFTTVQNTRELEIVAITNGQYLTSTNTGKYTSTTSCVCTMTGNVKTTWVQPDGTPRRAKAYVNINGKVCRAVSFVKPNPT